jgi:uncharacterized membrane protein
MDRGQNNLSAKGGPSAPQGLPVTNTGANIDPFEGITTPVRPAEGQPAIPPSAASLAELQAMPLFKGVSSESLTALHATLDEYWLPKGAVISSASPERDRFHVILKGRVEFVVPDGSNNEIVVGEAGPGGFFGELEILCGKPSGIKVRVIEEVHSLGFEAVEFEALARQHPEIGFAVLREAVPVVSHIDKLLASTVSRNSRQEFDKELTAGQRVADRVAEVMGSWSFIIGQGTALAAWAIWNVIPGLPHFDPYPFIFMNLALSCQAAFAAPIIMMSQNRQSAQDRVAADVDHVVNVKTEVGVNEIVRRLDRLEELVKRHDAKSGSNFDTRRQLH